MIFKKPELHCRNIISKAFWKFSVNIFVWFGIFQFVCEKCHKYVEFSTFTAVLSSLDKFFCSIEKYYRDKLGFAIVIPEMLDSEQIGHFRDIDWKFKFFCNQLFESENKLINFFFENEINSLCQYLIKIKVLNLTYFWHFSNHKLHCIMSYHFYIDYFMNSFETLLVSTHT